MKNLIIVVMVLVVTILVYGFDAERSQTFLDNYIQCGKEFDVESTKLINETINCALEEDEQIFDGLGQYKIDEILIFLEDIFSGETLGSVQKYFRECQNKAARNMDPTKKNTEYISSCMVDIITIYYKPK